MLAASDPTLAAKLYVVNRLPRLSFVDPMTLENVLEMHRVLCKIDDRFFERI